MSRFKKKEGYFGKLIIDGVYADFSALQVEFLNFFNIGLVQ